VGVDVGLVLAQPPLVGALGAGVVAGAHPQHAGRDDDLPARPLPDRPGQLGNRRQQVGRRAGQLGGGEVWLPELTDVEAGELLGVPPRFGI
jgi:hypothetical protein